MDSTELKRNLEQNIEALLVKYEEESGLSVVDVIVGRTDTSAFSEAGGSSIVSGVIVRAELNPPLFEGGSRG